MRVTGALLGVWMVLAASGCSHEQPPLTQRRSDLEWLPLAGPLGSTRPEVVVLLDGRPTPGILDTGASISTVSLELAERMGLQQLVDDSGEPLLFANAHGAVGDAWAAKLDSIAVGRAWVHDVDVMVMPLGRELVLIGYDILRRFDVVLLADLGVVALMPPGTAPLEGREIAVRLDADDRSLLVDVSAAGAHDTARASLIVDTGADVTVFPSTPAMLAGVPVDLRLRSISLALQTTKNEPGRYALRPLHVGAVDVGDVLAWEGSGNDGRIGLLGNDVLGRFRTTLVSALAPGGPRLFVANVPRPPPLTTCDTRDRPSQAIADDAAAPSRRRLDDARSGEPVPPPTPSSDACVQVSIKALSSTDRDTLRAQEAERDDAVRRRLVDAGLDDTPPADHWRGDVCLEVKIRRQTARQRVQLVIADDFDVLAGGTISMIFNVDNIDAVDSFCMPLVDNTRALGVQERSPLHIRAVRVDDEVDAGLCPTGVCHWYLGP